GCRGGAEVANVTREVREWRDDIVFVHKVKAGAADRSYGIQVARLAGLPKTVTARASEVLALLEKHERRAGAAREPLLEDLPLFAPRAARPSPAEARAQRVATALQALNPDELTPKAALDALYALKELALQPQNGNGAC